MNGRPRFTGRFVDVLPVLAAMVFHAIAMQRWLLVLPLGCALTALVLSRTDVVVTLSRSMSVGVIGLIAGLAFAVTDVPPVGPLPPVIMSAVTGAILVLASYFSLGGRIRTAWVCSWFLVALSASSEAPTTANVWLVAFLALSLVAAAFQEGVLRAGALGTGVLGGGRRSLLAFQLFVVLVGAATFGFFFIARQLDGVIQGAVEQFFLEGPLPKVTGVGNDILLGSRSSIAISRQPLFELSERTGPLRVNVMDRFDGHRWSTSHEIQAVRHTLSEAPRRTGQTRTVELVLLDDVGGRLPSPAGTWDVNGAEAFFEGGWVLRGKALAAMIHMTGDRSERLPMETPAMPDLLEVPDDLRTELEPITDELLKGTTTPGDKADLLQDYFQQHFEYSLETNLMGPEHPLVQLIKERRPAYCVYFASAMAVMLRTQGIPSRVVSGYLPDETNPITGRVTVRQRDSHAWVEAWIPDEHRFVAYDPTPGRSREQVIGTSQALGLVSALTGATGSWMRRQWLSFRDNPVGSLTALWRSPLTWIVVVSMLVLFFRPRWFARQRSARTVGQASVDPELKRAYDRYLRSLRQLGITPRPAETDEELLERLASLQDEKRLAKAREFISRYRRSRYRGDAFDIRILELARL